MKIPPVKGTRDFYPPDMAVRNWIIDGWKKVSVRNGFEEYDGPIFEYLKMFQIKSGDEIVEQLFSLQDRGGRDLALRPEITPTLARMVNQRINSLPKPIKWFSVPRLFRAERPQKGRLREFFQWNIDIIGVDDVLADAEVIFCAVDYLREVGLSADDIVVKISSRKLLAALLEIIGIPEIGLEPLYTILDKRSKLSTEDFEELLADSLGQMIKTEEELRRLHTLATKEKKLPRDALKEIFTIGSANEYMRKRVIELMAVESIEHISDCFQLNETAIKSLDELQRLFELLDVMGVADFCVFDIGIVRGLAYYTGIVYEIYDKASELRAIGGGGRYDDLLNRFGGPSIPATGFGIGDCVLGILLEEKGLLKPTSRELDYFVAFVQNVNFYDEHGNIKSTAEDEAVKLTMKLRSAKRTAGFSYKDNLSKQLKEASDQNAKKCIIIGDEFKDNQLAVKDMDSGEQELIELDKFFAELK